jgi:segregation and condensation protein A
MPPQSESRRTDIREVTITTYRVTLDVFEGPLDVLLRLIEREELDISKVSLAIVADQFLGYVATLREISAANLAEFLVVAAKLLVIKSRALLPKPENESDDEEHEEDPGEELARQLEEYKRFKAVAAQLRAIEETGQRAYPRIAPRPQIERRLVPGEVSLTELLDALKRALELHPPTPPVDDVVAPVVVHIADCMRTLLDMATRHAQVRFGAVLQRARSRLEVIVTFLALLELIKQQRLRAVQTRPFGEILIEAREPDPDADIPATDLSAYDEPSNGDDGAAA